MPRSRTPAQRRAAKARQSPAVEDLNSKENAAYNERGEAVYAISIPPGVYGELFFYSEPFLTEYQADLLVRQGRPRFNDGVCIW